MRERRSGCTSGEHYPPSGSRLLWSSDDLTCNTLSRQSTAFASFFPLAIAFSKDLLLEPIEFIGWCDVAYRTMQPRLIVLLHFHVGIMSHKHPRKASRGFTTVRRCQQFRVRGDSEYVGWNGPLRQGACNAGSMLNLCDDGRTMNVNAPVHRTAKLELPLIRRIVTKRARSDRNVQPAK